MAPILKFYHQHKVTNINLSRTSMIIWDDFFRIILKVNSDKRFWVDKSRILRSLIYEKPVFGGLKFCWIFSPSGYHLLILKNEPKIRGGELRIVPLNRLTVTIRNCWNNCERWIFSNEFLQMKILYDKNYFCCIYSIHKFLKMFKFVFQVVSICKHLVSTLKFGNSKTNKT